MLNTDQIENQQHDDVLKAKRVVQTGSNAVYQLTVLAGTTETSYDLPFTSNEVLLINDGGANIQFAFGGNSANPQINNGTLYDDAAAQWTYTGTWTADTTIKFYGTQSNKSAIAASKATLIPSGNCQSITWAMIMGQGAGIANIEVSQDGGTTWVKPSTIAGITRSDGAFGTSLDTLDCYLNVSVQYTNLIFNFPSLGNWALRITATGTKNTAASAATIFNDAGFASTTVVPFGTNYVTVKAGESLPVQVRTNKVNLYSATAGQSCRIIPRS